MNDPILQEIKDRLNVADVIGGYITVKKAGSSFKALCPFHSEKTPSFQISPQKQIWHCFGCGEGGDIFGFVMKYENLEFKDALKILADKAGVQLPSYRPENKPLQDEKELLLRINDFAARYYNKVLMEDSRGKQALEYLKNRGLTEGTIKQWQIGFAPDDFHALERALLAKKVNLQDAIKAGVITKNERGMYDRFRGRVTFPIYGYFGDTLGFSARILNDDGKSAKYINSPETAVYNKSRTLFGLNFAKDSIRKKDEMIIVEGQMDCISLHQAGFKNVIASSGTAYNESAVDFTSARRLSNNVKLCFDSDSAGQTALKKTGEMLLKQNFKIKVVILTSAKDPDELVKKSPGLWEKAVSEAVWFLDWQMDIAEKMFLKDPVEQKHYLSQYVVPMLGLIADPLEQDHYVHKLSTRFSISEKTILDQIKKQTSGKSSELNQNGPNVLNGTLLLEKEILGGLIVLPEFLAEVKESMAVEDFEDVDAKALLNAIILGDKGNPELKNSTVAKEAQFMVESQLEELGGNMTALMKELQKAFALLKIGAIKKRQQTLQTEIKIAETEKNKAKTEELNKQFAQISAQRVKFEVLL